MNKELFLILQKYDKLNKQSMKYRINDAYIKHSIYFHKVLFLILPILSILNNLFALNLFVCALFYSLLFRYNMKNIAKLKTKIHRSLGMDMLVIICIYSLLKIIFPILDVNTSLFELNIANFHFIEFLLYFILLPVIFLLNIFNIKLANKKSTINKKDYKEQKIKRLQELKNRIKEENKTIEECEYSKSICVKNNFVFSNAEINKMLSALLYEQGCRNLNEYKIKNRKKISEFTIDNN